jgi:glutamyl-tRNA synthetase
MRDIKLRGRLAPSPTGALHLGNARSFLLAWLSIRSRGGTLVLRMEDLDHPKVKPGAAQQALDDLRWLGLDWDEGPDCGGPYAPYIQSERIDRYREALARLKERGLVYPCTCSRRDVETAQSAPHAGDDGPRYPGTCRGRYPDYQNARAGRPADRWPAWRFIAPDRDLRFVDAFHGATTGNVARDSGDFVIARHPDGAGYMLGVVVDDAAMGITEVLRGDDLRTATCRQILLYEALGLAPPTFVHTPLMVGPDGRRLAKRHGDTRIAHLRELGFSPHRILGFLAHGCGWAAPDEALTLDEVLTRYDRGAIPTAAIVFAPETLDQRLR